MYEDRTRKYEPKAHVKHPMHHARRYALLLSQKPRTTMSVTTTLRSHL